MYTSSQLSETIFHLVEIGKKMTTFFPCAEKGFMLQFGKYLNQRGVYDYGQRRRNTGGTPDAVVRRSGKGGLPPFLCRRICAVSLEIDPLSCPQ
jgi:hypothetical protein